MRNDITLFILNVRTIRGALDEILIKIITFYVRHSADDCQ